MVSNLWEKTNYASPLTDHSGVIIEYDLSKANISALVSNGAITMEMYNNLYNAEKQYREIVIGKMVRSNPELYKVISKGIKDAKRMLFEANGITDNEVLSIKNDAVFVTTSRQFKTKFGNYYFAQKHMYSQYIRLSNKIEFYYRYDQVQDLDIVDIKGISQEKMNRYQPFVLFIINILRMFSTVDIMYTLDTFNKYQQDYITLRLPKETYRELNAENCYRIRTPLFSYGVDEINQYRLQDIDIGYNFNLLRDIGAIVARKYFSEKNYK